MKRLLNTTEKVIPAVLRQDRDCDENWWGAENNTTAYTKNPPKSCEGLIKKTCFCTSR